MPGFGFSIEVTIEAGNQEEAEQIANQIIHDLKSRGINAELSDGPDELADE